MVEASKMLKKVLMQEKMSVAKEETKKKENLKRL